MRLIRTAVIGCGHAARDFHLPGLALCQDAEISLCDVVETRLRACGEQFHVPPSRQYADYRRMLSEQDPEAVFVLLAQYPRPSYDGPSVYLRIVLDALAQKRNVLVEKPLAITLDHGRRLVEAAEEAGVSAMCSFNRRFYPTVDYALKRARQAGGVQSAVCAYCKFTPPGVMELGDVLTRDMIHHVDLVRYLIGGDIVDVAAHAPPAGPDGASAFHALITNATGQAGLLCADFRAGARVETIQMHAPGVSACIATEPANGDPGATTLRLYEGASAAPSVLSAADIVGSPDFASARGFAAADRYFLDCVRTGQQPHCNFADAFETLLLCDRIRRAAAQPSPTLRGRDAPLAGRRCEAAPAPTRLP